MSPMPSKKRKLPPEEAAELERLQAQVRHAEKHGQFDTCHHEMLKRRRSEPGLIPARKIEETQHEVNDGKPDL